MKHLIMCAIMLGAFIGHSEELEDTYNFKMVLKVPKVIDNMESLGRREYKTQTIKGKLRLIYKDGLADEIVITNLVNRSHKINGKYITYNSYISEDIIPRLSYIGDNKKRSFKVPNTAFYLIADPSYNIGEVEEDNSLYLMIAGSGKSSKNIKHLKGFQIIKSMKGTVSGTMGCACTEYGHISPTRLVGAYGYYNEVTDVAAVYGTWSMDWNNRFIIVR